MATFDEVIAELKKKKEEAVESSKDGGKQPLAADKVPGKLKWPDSYKGLHAGQVKNLIDELVNKKDAKALIDILQYAKNKTNVKSAIYALDGLGDKTAIPALLDEALYGQHGLAVREAAIRSLGHIGKHDVVDLLIYILGKGSHSCHAAAEALGEIKDERALKPLTIVMNDPNEDTQLAREEAVKALGQIGTKASIATLIVALDSELADTVSSVLKEVGQPAIEPLISALGHANKTVKKKATVVLEEMVLNMKSTEELIAILESDIEDADVTKSVVQVLAQSGDKSTTGVLLTAFDKYLLTNLDMAEEIVYALGKIKDSKAVQPLLNTLKTHFGIADEDYRIQTFMIIALGEIGDKKATVPLLKLLIDKSNELRTRITAAWALGLICDEKAIESLTAVLIDNRDEDMVRRQVFDTLFKYPAETPVGPMLAYMKAHPDLVSQTTPMGYSDNS